MPLPKKTAPANTDKKPAAKLSKGLPKPVAAAAAAPKEDAKPPKVAKPFEESEIVIFKGYNDNRKDGLFTKDEELAVVGTKERDGHQLVGCVKSSEYYQFMEDNDSVEGQELNIDELKRTSKKVEPLYHLPIVGEMKTILADGVDPLEKAIKLHGDQKKASFYLGGVLGRLIKEIDVNTKKPIYCGYTDENGDNFTSDKPGIDAFLAANFGEDFGKHRKAYELIDIYETFSALDKPDSRITEIEKIGWSKAALIAKHVTNENVAQLMQDAKENSFVELKTKLQTDYTTAGSTVLPTKGASVKRITIEFRLYEDRAVAIDTIIQAAAKQTGIEDRSQLLEHIIHEWAGDHITEIKVKADKKAAAKLKEFKNQKARIPADHPSMRETNSGQAPAAAAAPA